MTTGAPIENGSLRYSLRLHTYADRFQRFFASTRSRMARRGAAGADFRPSTVRILVKSVKRSNNPPLPPRSFDWLSLEELTAEAMRRGLLTSNTWDGSRHTMTIMGERYSFTPKQARAFLFGVIAGQRRAEMIEN